MSWLIEPRDQLAGNRPLWLTGFDTARGLSRAKELVFVLESIDAILVVGDEKGVC